MEIKTRGYRPQALARGEQRDWYKIENHGTSADVYIYDEIGWSGVTASGFVSALTGLTANQMTVHINSTGGEVADGIAIYNTLLSHPAHVDVVVDGWALSIASVIAMAGDTVTMGVGSRMMVHMASGGVFGTPTYLRETADILDALARDIAGFYARKAGGSAEDWLAIMEAETWYSAEEAVAAGLASGVVEVPPSPVPQNRWDLSVFKYAGRENAPAPLAVEPTPEPEPVNVGSLISRAIREAISA